MLRRQRFFGLTVPFVALACTGNATFAGPDEPPARCTSCAGAGDAPTAGAAGTPSGGGGAGPNGPNGPAAGAGLGGAAGGAPGAGASGGGGGAPAGGVTVRIANFNVENLFDDFNSGGFGEAELTPPSPQAYEKEVDDTASLLAMLGADLIALAEVENRGVLDKLADKLQEKRPGVTYPERWLITGNDRVRNVALLSTAPLEPSEVVSHRFERFDLEGNLLGPEAGGESYTYARDCLEVGVRYRGYPLTLFAVHFKSKSNDDPQRRLAEARRTRRLVDERFAADPGARLVVLGDFNDTPESVPLRALTEGLVPGAAPLAGGVSLLPPQLAWTHPFGTPNKIIDDQLASPAMAAARDAASITVWHDNDAGFPDGLREVSDHSPVAISYRLGEAPLP